MLHTADTSNILSPDSLSPFWVSWLAGTIKFGKGEVVGQQQVFEFVDPTPHVVQSLAFSGSEEGGVVEWEITMPTGECTATPLPLINTETVPSNS